MSNEPIDLDQFRTNRISGQQPNADEIVRTIDALRGAAGGAVPPIHINYIGDGGGGGGNLTARVTLLETKMGTVEGKIDGLQTRIDKLPGLKTLLGVAAGTVATLSGVAFALHISQRDMFLPKLVENSEKIIANSTNIEHLQEDIEVMIEQQDSIDRSIKSTNESLKQWGSKLNQILKRDD